MSQCDLDILRAEAAERGCPATGYQSLAVCTPVTIVPFARAGLPQTRCCGQPVVTAGTDVCTGVRNGVCSFTLSQEICVAVPVTFGAAAATGDTFVDCRRASAQDICTNCRRTGEEES